jgi:uncharacterized repeat protein (TIGR02543 family)
MKHFLSDALRAQVLEKWKGILTLFFLSVFVFTVRAAGDTDFAGGTGTSSDPWLIANANQFVKIKDNNGASGAPKYFKLTADLDLGMYIDEEDPEGWLPLGVNNAGGAYSVTSLYISIDGDNHIIKGLWINHPDDSKVGLIAQVSTGAVIKNLGIILDNSKGGIKGYDNTGAVVGYCNGAMKLDNVFVIGNVSGRDYVGGAVGYARAAAAGDFTNIYYVGNVSGRNYVGGILNHASTSGSAYLNNSVAVGTVTGTDKVGGIAGQGGASSSRNLTIANCFALNAVSGTSNVGALVGFGYDASTTRLKLTDSFVNGEASELPVVGNIPSYDTQKKTTSDLLLQATYTGFDFTTIWETATGTYPYPAKIKSLNGASDVYAPASASYTYNGTTTPITLASAVPVNITGDVFPISFAVTPANGGNAYAGATALGLYVPDPHEYTNVITGVSQSGIAAPYALTIKRTGIAAEFTFTFKYNNGDPDLTVPANMGNNYTIAKPTDPVRPDYKFINWYAEADFKTVWDFAPQVFEDVTVYAQWRQWLNVTYKYQDAALTPDYVTPDIEEGSKLTAPAITVPADSIFLGWFTAPNPADGVQWNFASDVLTQDVTLYAGWLKKSDVSSSSSLSVSPAVTNSASDTWYYVKFTDVDGVWDAVSANPATTGSVETVVLNPASKSRANVQLWKLVASGDLNSYYIVNQAGNILRYASTGINAPASGTLRTLNITPDTLGGYTLHFSNLAADVIVRRFLYSGVTYIMGGTGGPPAASQTDLKTSILFIPSNTFVKSYTVTFNVDGATTAQTVFEGGKAATPAAPAKADYAFKGWYSSDNLAWDDNTVVSSDTTLYAQWTKIHKVVFNVDGGVVSTQLVPDGGNAVLPTAPVKEGYTFTDWIAADSAVFNVSGAITSDTTLYVLWNKVPAVIPSYTVTFDSDQGTAVASATVQEGDFVTEPAVPTRAGYTFLGWVLKWNFAADAVKDNITLTAQWEEEDNGISSPEASPAAGSLKAHVDGAGLLKVRGLNAGEKFKVYNTQGVLIDTAEIETQLPARGVYVVAAGTGTVKVTY